jgi:hypothetical protein
MENRKKIILLLAIIAAVLAGVFLYYKSVKSPTETGGDNPVKVKGVSLTEGPAGLPENLPIEAGDKILENFEATAPGNRIQGTRKFTTNKTLDGALDTYISFFAKSSWVVADTKSDDISRSAILKRNEGILTIRVRDDQDLQKNVVEITLTEIRN